MSFPRPLFYFAVVSCIRDCCTTSRTPGLVRWLLAPRSLPQQGHPKHRTTGRAYSMQQLTPVPSRIVLEAEPPASSASITDRNAQPPRWLSRNGCDQTSRSTVGAPHHKGDSLRMLRLTPSGHPYRLDCPRDAPEVSECGYRRRAD